MIVYRGEYPSVSLDRFRAEGAKYLIKVWNGMTSKVSQPNRGRPAFLKMAHSEFHKDALVAHLEKDDRYELIEVFSV